jgi:hypothetical protein
LQDREGFFFVAFMAVLALRESSDLVLHLGKEVSFVFNWFGILHVGFRMGWGWFFAVLCSMVSQLHCSR